VDDAPTLVWLANLAAIELHTQQHSVDGPDRALAVVFDLDPGPPAGVLDRARTALDPTRSWSDSTSWLRRRRVPRDCI
jgi:bifunctional non-homologous end joining protein LigD